MRYQITAQHKGKDVSLADAEDLVVAAALLAAIATSEPGRYENCMLIDTQDSHVLEEGGTLTAIIALANP